MDLDALEEGISIKDVSLFLEYAANSAERTKSKEDTYVFTMGGYTASLEREEEGIWRVENIKRNENTNKLY